MSTVHVIIKDMKHSTASHPNCNYNNTQRLLVTPEKKRTFLEAVRLLYPPTKYQECTCSIASFVTYNSVSQTVFREYCSVNSHQVQFIFISCNLINYAVYLNCRGKLGSIRSCWNDSTFTTLNRYLLGTINWQFCVVQGLIFTGHFVLRFFPWMLKLCAFLPFCCARSYI